MPDLPPRVSIGLPVYNGERYLQRTLDDLLGQSFSDFELIICDNASTDETERIAREAAALDPRIRYVRNATNIGALANANLAYEISRGELYALSAYDDRHAPTFLEALVDALDEHTDAVLAYGDSTLIDELDVPLLFDPQERCYTDRQGIRHEYDAKLNCALPAERIERFRSVLKSNDVNAPIYGLFRRAALVHIGPHQLYGSDRLIVARAALLGPFAFVPQALFGYRIHSASTLHMSRYDWLAREAGTNSVGSALDGIHTLRAYMRSASMIDGPVRDRIRTRMAVMGYALRPDVLRKVFVPGPDNYFGWKNWPGGWSARVQSNKPFDQPVTSTRHWEWLLTAATV